MSDLSKGQRRVLEQFDQAWRNGKPPDLVRFHRRLVEEIPLSLPNGEHHHELLRALVRVDIEHRWKRFNESGQSHIKPLLLDDYAHLLPILGPLSELPVDLIAAEFQARYCWGDSPSEESYFKRFPRHANLLKDRLAKVAEEAHRNGAKLPRIEGLRVISKLGRGGFGTVYKAKHIESDRYVAVKFIRLETDRDKDAFARFLKEARAIARIKHPNVLTLFHSKADGDHPHLIFEFASGGTLRARIQEWKRKWPNGQPPNQVKWQKHAAALVRDIARGLSAAHAVGIIHRDIKPENILFDENHHPMIADFGLAREKDEELSTKGAGEGTREYQAPEQIQRSKQLDLRTDIYSLGVVLFELLTGDLPFTGPLADAAVANDVVYAPTPRRFNPAIALDLQAICEKCLQKKPEKRFDSAGALADDLDRFIKGEPTLTRPIRMRERCLRLVKRHRLAVGFSAALLLSMAIGIGVSIERSIAAALERKENEITKLQNALLAKEKEEIEKESQKKDATIADQAVRVEKERSKAVVAVKDKELHDYASDMQSAQAAWTEGDKARVINLLVRHNPAISGESVDLRGFEWYYWDHLLATSIPTIENGGQCRALAVDHSAKYMAVSDWERISLWNLATGEQVWRAAMRDRRNIYYAEDQAFLADRSTAISPDGKFVAGVTFTFPEEGRRGTLKVWETETGQEHLSIENDMRISGRSVVFDPESKLVLAGGYEDGWQSWNLESKLPDVDSGVQESDGVRPQLPVTMEIVNFLGFSRDGQQLFTSCLGKKTSSFWHWRPSFANNRVVSKYRSEMEKAGFGGHLPGGLVQSTSGSDWRIVSVRDSRVHILSPNGIAIPGAGIPDVRMRDWSPDPPLSATCADQIGEWIVAGGADTIVHRWKVNPLDSTMVDSRIYRGHEDGITCVTLLPDGRPVSADRKGSIRVWPEDDFEVVKLPELNESMRVKLIVDPTGHDVKIEDEDSSVTRIPLEDNHRFIAAKLSPSGKYLALSSGPYIGLGRLLLWNTSEKKQLLSKRCGALLNADDIVFSGDESVMAATLSGNEVRAWSTQTGQRVAVIPAPTGVVMSLNRTGDLLAVGDIRRGLFGKPTTVSIWNLGESRKVADITAGVSSRKRAPFFAFSPDGNKLLADGSPCTLWDARSGQRLDTTLGGIEAETVEASEDARRLYFMNGSTVEVCCARTLRPLLKFRISPSITTRILSDKHAVAGANGFMSSMSIDRALGLLVARWQGEKAE